MKLKGLYAAVTVVVLMTGFVRAVPNSTAVGLIGRECSTCHGARGINVVPTFPDLAGQHAAYREAQLK